MPLISLKNLHKLLNQINVLKHTLIEINQYEPIVYNINLKIIIIGFYKCKTSITLENLNKTNKKTLPTIDSVLTGDERIELPLKVLETLVIPFDQSPIYWPCSLHC